MPQNLSTAKTQAALRTGSRISLQALLILVITAAVLWLLGKTWPALWPVVIALLITTFTWPLNNFMRRHGWPSALAATVSTVVFLLLAAGTVVLIAVPVAQQSTQMASGITSGIQKLRDWAEGPPLNLSDDRLGQLLDAAATRVQDSIASIATAALSGAGTVVNSIVTAILALFLMFFFLKDGHRFLPWLSRQLPGRLATDVPAVANRAWDTLGSFMRSQAFVGLIDAAFIGLGLWIVGVPLVLPLAVLTFVAAFVPIVGALFAGFVAVLIALVYNGPTDALIMLAIIIAVQQLEGNVLQPVIQSRGLKLHAAVILLAVTLGGSLAGIVGSLLAVPIAAVMAVIWNYLRDQLSDPPPQEPDTIVDVATEGLA